MKTTDEKLQFKAHFFKLGQGRVIPVESKDYWRLFWEYPESTNDIYELLTSQDIQTIRDQNLSNFILLVRVISSEIIGFGEFKTLSPSCITHLNNCIRFLTKLLPYLYEIHNYANDLENIVFWSDEFDPLQFALEKVYKTPNDHKKVIGPKLITSLVNLLFTKGYTIDMAQDPESNTSFSTWEPGIGSSAKYSTPNLVIDSNRATVLKLLLTMVSTSFYYTPSNVISNGSKFLTVLVATLPRIELLTLLCSFINITCRSARPALAESALYYDNNQLTRMRHLLTTYSIQLLSIMLVYPLPAQSHTEFLKEFELITTPKPYNLARIYIGKLHKESELSFFASYLLHILKDHVTYTEESSKLLNFRGVQPSIWSVEAVMIIWELFQCNKCFRSSVGGKFLPELVMVLLFYVNNFYDNNAHRNLARLSSYFLLYISADRELMKSILRPVNVTFYDTLPNLFKATTRPVTTRDFLVIQICLLLMTLNPIPPSSNLASYNVATPKKQNADQLSITLVEIFYNLVPLADPEYNEEDVPAKKISNSNPGGGLSYAACASINQLIIRFSLKKFLLEASFHGDILALIIRAVAAAALKEPVLSRMLLYSILRNEKVYDTVWNSIFNLDTNLQSLEEIDEDNLDDSIISEPENNLSRVESHRSELSINPHTPKLESDLTDSEFFESLSNSNSKRSSIVSFSNTTVLDIKESLISEASDEGEAIRASFRPKPPTGMSSKAREKLPMDSPLKRFWGGSDALRIILTVLIPHMKLSLKGVWTNRDHTVDSFVMIKHIEALDFEELYAQHKSLINQDFLPTTPFEPLKFSWSHLSLGWYTSVLYGRVFNSNETVQQHIGFGANIMKNISNSFATLSKLTASWTPFSKGSYFPEAQVDESVDVVNYVSNSLTNVNHWSHTSIKLFKVETSQKESMFPLESKFTASSPVGTPGGVSDMANSLVRRFSDFRLNPHRNSVSSAYSINSMPGTPVEEQEGYFKPRNSVSSLYSVNAINRSRTATPRNSISM